MILFVSIGLIIIPLLNCYFFIKAGKESLHTFKKYWLGLKSEQRNELIIKEVKCYYLGKFYEKHATKKLKKYLKKLDDMDNGTFERRHVDSYGMRKEEDAPHEGKNEG